MSAPGRNQIRVLCLGYCFPPVASPEAYVSAKSMAAIPDTEVDIIAGAPDLFAQPPDHSLDGYVAMHFGRVERVNSFLFRHLTKIPHLPIRPDRYLLMTNPVVARAEGMQVNQYDCLVTRSQYHSIHVAGRILKRRYPGLPWVASFSDPWSGGIYERKIPISSAWGRRLEKGVLEEADAIVFPTEEMRDFVISRNSEIRLAEKSHVVAHGFDPALYATSIVKYLSSEVEIGMFGSFYGPRSPNLLLEAIDRVARQPSPPRFSLRIFGTGEEAFHRVLARYTAASRYVVHGGTLNHTAALADMAAFDILLLSDAPMPPPSIFLSSKLIDYLGAGRPVFAITPEGATTDVVRRAGGWTVSPDDPAIVAEVLAKAIREFNSNKAASYDEVRAEYRIDRIGGELRDVLDRIIPAPSCRQ